MPCVGSSMISVPRQGIQPIANDNLLLIAAAQRAGGPLDAGVLMPTLPTIVSAKAGLLGRKMPPRLYTVRGRQGEVFRTAKGITNPCRLRSSELARHHALLWQWAGLLLALAVDHNLAAVDRVQTEDGPKELCAALILARPAMPSTSPSVKLERDVVQHTGPVETSGPRV